MNNKSKQIPTDRYTITYYIINRLYNTSDRLDFNTNLRDNKTPSTI